MGFKHIILILTGAEEMNDISVTLKSKDDPPEKAQKNSDV